MTLLEVIINAIEEKKGNDIAVFDFKGEHSMMDGFVVTDAGSNRQMWAIIDYIKDQVLKNGYQVSRIEGDNHSRWVLIDCYDYVVHVFESDERDVYKLEKLWADYLSQTTSS